MTMMSGAVLFAARGLSYTYRRRGAAFTRGGSPVTAVDDVSLELDRGQALAVVGESGAGKTTLTRLLLGVLRPSAGSVHLDEMCLSALSPARLRPHRRRFQAVFQDPSASLDSRQTIAATIAEPLVAHRLGSAAEQRARVAALLALTGLDPAVAARRPGALSAGQRQRVAIARALAPAPELLLLDEPVASLDASVRSDVATLLAGLRAELGLALLVVTHDLALARFLCDRALVLYRGRVVESGPSHELLTRPHHPYTIQLVAAESALLTGAAPSADPTAPTAAGEGCRCRDRCPRQDARCAVEPPLLAVAPGHAVACWRPGNAPPSE
jgi:oligopeptide/dipeptide ABC transporter ATP-binding protein